MATHIHVYVADAKHAKNVGDATQGSTAHVVYRGFGINEAMSDKDLYITKQGGGKPFGVKGPFKTIEEAKKKIDEVVDGNKTTWDGKDAFPEIVTYKGERYSKTSKTGKNFASGEESTEYRLESYGMGKTKIDKRVWRTSSGKVTQDVKSKDGNVQLEALAKHLHEQGMDFRKAMFKMKEQFPSASYEEFVYAWRKGTTTDLAAQGSIEQLKKDITNEERLLKARKETTSTRLKFLKEEMDKAENRTGDSETEEQKSKRRGQEVARLASVMKVSEKVAREELIAEEWNFQEALANLKHVASRDAAVDPEKYYVCGASTGMVMLGPFNTLEEALAAKKVRRYGSDVSAMKGSMVIKKSKAFE